MQATHDEFSRLTNRTSNPRSPNQDKIYEAPWNPEALPSPLCLVAKTGQQPHTGKRDDETQLGNTYVCMCPNWGGIMIGEKEGRGVISRHYRVMYYFMRNPGDRQQYLFPIKLPKPPGNLATFNY